MEQLETIGLPPETHQEYHITEGNEYLVLGLETYVRSSVFGTCTAIRHETDYGHLIASPAMLFEIVDPRASQHWRAKLWPDGSITLWPESFYQDFYFEDFSEGASAIMDDYRRVRSLLDQEHDIREPRS
ncbi:MAG TPA: hypothetical protein VFR15_01545 [Chloroflexia bacterium]|nr:hypothetical protein [Chloroflexia bacterium]